MAVTGAFVVAPATAQITQCVQGPPGGPFVTAGAYNSATASWDEGPAVSLAPGELRQIRCETPRAFTLQLVGTDYLNVTYDQANSVLGGGGCGAGVRCAVLQISCDATLFELVGPLNTDEEQSDQLEVCTLPGPNQACRPIGRWDCDKQQAAVLDPVTGLHVVTPWGDALTIPAFGGPAAVNIVVSNAFPLPDPAAVPHGFLPITEAVTLSPPGLTLPAGTLTIQYSEGEVRGGLEPTVSAFVFDRGASIWLPMDSVVDTLSNTITVEITEFGTYGFSAAPASQVCLVDPDGDIDADDIAAILAARGSPAAPGDARDADGDGLITSLDAKRCLPQCTRPRCQR
jgi:hypothetical protein